MHGGFGAGSCLKQGPAQCAVGPADLQGSSQPQQFCEPPNSSYHSSDHSTWICNDCRFGPCDAARVPTALIYPKQKFKMELLRISLW